VEFHSPPLHKPFGLHYIKGVTLCDYGNKRPLGISSLDPGAVPGASTKAHTALVCVFWRGRNRLDTCGKEAAFARQDAVVKKIKTL